MHLLIVDEGARLKAAHGHLSLGIEGCRDMNTPRPGPEGQLRGASTAEDVRSRKHTFIIGF